MKKYYKNPTKRDIKKSKKLPTFNKEQLAFYEGFYKNLERLESEWNLCRDQYDDALKFVREKGIKFDAKMSLQKIAKYWNARKLAMEKAIDDETLKKFKEKRNEPERTDEEK
jgi:hypothetical protein